MGGEIRDGVGVSRGVRVLSLLVLDLVPASLSCSLEILARELTQGFCQIMRNLGAIVKDRGLNKIFPSRLADFLGIELLEL